MNSGDDMSVAPLVKVKLVLVTSNEYFDKITEGVMAASALDTGFVVFNAVHKEDEYDCLAYRVLDVCQFIKG